MSMHAQPVVSWQGELKSAKAELVDAQKEVSWHWRGTLQAAHLAIVTLGRRKGLRAI